MITLHWTMLVLGAIFFMLFGGFISFMSGGDHNTGPR
jgi:hypothetical protein